MFVEYFGFTAEKSETNDEQCKKVTIVYLYTEYILDGASSS